MAQRRWLLPGLICVALLALWCVGLFDRGYWTPDEPREADISWRMGWQADRAVPQLAGEAFCEKPPLTYWLAGASMHAFGTAGWAARLPNLFYALLTTLSVGWLARRLIGTVGAWAAAAASATLLLSYQVAIWLATDAPLLAATAVALAGLHAGLQARRRSTRLLGYSIMHAALAIGFLAKSAAGWMVPVLTMATLIAWERRWRELLRWELWAGLVLQVLLVGAWIAAVYAGPDGVDHLRVFFWNNLVGRFTHVDAPAALQYTSGHRNSPGKYLIEMPVYLFPWTALVVAAMLRVWRRRHDLGRPQLQAVRFAIAGSVPALAVLSFAATARNIYFAPALPAIAILLGWWATEAGASPVAADRAALRCTAAMLALASLAGLAIVLAAGFDAGDAVGASGLMAAAMQALPGVAVTVTLAILGWRAAGRQQTLQALCALLLSWSCLLTATASQAYPYVDRWQDLAVLATEVGADVGEAPLVLVAPDETTRAWVDLYLRRQAPAVAAPPPAGAVRQYALVQLEGREPGPRLGQLAARLGIAPRAAPLPAAPAWIGATSLYVVRLYALPNGRRYALLAAAR